MRIVEAWQHGPALCVDDDGLRTPQALHVAVRSDQQDLVALHGDSLRHRAVAVSGVDAPVDDDQIHGTVLALGADNESGNEGDADDEGDEVSRDAGRHAPDSISGRLTDLCDLPSSAPVRWADISARSLRETVRK